MKIYSDEFLKAVAEYLRKTECLDVKEVISFSDRTVDDGYCDTCRYEYAVIDIAYRDSNRSTKEFTYKGDFADLIRALKD
ncbi:hypothetical protein [Nocardia arthritidis]|uniref:Uncharacterized protein n=1 Tax=Nocardia arthritidis TaxID=228602 RepID=A0A6G9YTJ2_9NOCA|nr:hypothetical protein [Nocardia arthritidis]QIS16446.1 hypothetical protein F5544_43195 [Nocardia arthritidis]QIS16460.1 hypothetical protein F5544_43265 [Nocardia arthritidis]